MAGKKRLFFTITRILGLFIMGLAVAVIIALSQVNLETLRGNVLAILRDATGLPVEIDGAVSWKFSLRPQVELNQVRVPNADWAKHKYAFSAEKVDVRMNLLSLLRNRPTIQNVKIYDATVCIEQNDKGQLSVVPFQDQTESVASSDATTTDAKPVATTPAKYPFTDPGLGGVEVRNLVAHVFDTTYSLAGFQIRYAPSQNGREYAGWIKSEKDVFPFIVSYSEYNAERKIYPVRVAFSTGGDALIANIALEATSKAPIDFIITGDIPDIAALGRIIDLDLLEMPTLKVNIAGGFDRKRLTVRKSTIIVRGTEISVSGVYDWSKKIPMIDANIDSQSIDLLELFPDLYGKKWIHPDRPLNVFHDIPLYGKEFLKFNLHLHADIGNLIVYRELNIRNIDLSVKLYDGDARVDATTTVGGGNISIAGNVAIDADGRMFVRAGVIGRDISVGNILNEIRINDLISD